MTSLVTTVDARRKEWLPQFVRHYRELGVDRMLITLHLQPETPRAAREMDVRQVSTLLNDLGTGLFAVLICDFASPEFFEHDNRVRTSAGLPEDWIVWADLDEFQVWPAMGLPAVLAESQELGFGQITGSFVDRVAEDGSLKPFDPSRPIWEQYPIGTNLTEQVLQGNTRKVAASKAVHPIAGGRHCLLSESARTDPRTVSVHHFKWDASVLQRLQFRLTESYRRNGDEWRETRRFLNHLERNGKIRVGALRHQRMPFKPAEEI